MGATHLNPQFLYHAYAMTYLELERARSERAPVPPSVLVRLTAAQEPLQRAVMRGMRDVERLRPMRRKRELLAVLERGGPGRPRVERREPVPVPSPPVAPTLA